MLPYILALVIGFGSLAFYMAAFFFPEVHRKNDFIWSGIGLFYALILWVCGERLTGAVLLGQMASVSLLGWLGWQTLTMRLELTSPDKRTEISPGILEKIKNLSIGGFGQQLLQPITSLLGKKQVKTPPSPTVAVTETVVQTTATLEDSPQNRIPDLELGTTIETKTIEVTEKPETLPSATDWEAETVSSATDDKDTGITPGDIISAIAETEVAPSPTKDNLSTGAETTDVTEITQTETVSTDTHLATAVQSTDEFGEETEDAIPDAGKAIAPPTPAVEAVAEKPEANLSPVKEKSGPIKQVSGLFKNFFGKKRSEETNQTPKTTELQTLPEQAIALSDEASTTDVVTPEVTESLQSSATPEVSWEPNVVSEEAISVESKTPEVTESPEPSEPSALSWEPNVIAEEVTPIESKTPEVTESPEPSTPSEVSWEPNVIAEEVTPIESKTPEVTESPEPPAPLGSPWDTIMMAEKVTEPTTESETPEAIPAVEDTTPSESPKIIFRNRPNSKLIELLKKPISSESPDSSNDTGANPE